MKKIRNFFIILNRRGVLALLFAIFYQLKYFFYKNIFSFKFLKKKIYNFKMFLNLKDRGLSRTLLLFGEREIDHKLILEKVLKKNMNIFDIGANIGYYALIQRKLVGHNAKITAIEPLPDNIKFLKKNLILNNDNKTKVIEAAVSNKSSYSYIYISDFFNLGTLNPEGSSKKFLKKKPIKVKTFSLIDLCLKNGFPNLIRMDVEGHEVKIFDNLIINKKKFKFYPMICFETHLSKYTKKNSMEDKLKELFEIGYQVKFASSSCTRGSNIIEKKYKYKPISKTIKTDEEERKIYKYIKNEDAIDIICKSGGLRTILLSIK